MGERARQWTTARVVPFERTGAASRIVREHLVSPLVAVTIWYGDQWAVVVDDGLTDLQAATVAMHASYEHLPPSELRDRSFTIWGCVCGECPWADVWALTLSPTHHRAPPFASTA